MKKIEFAALSFALFALILQAAGSNIANELTLIGFSLLSVIYFAFGYAVMNNITPGNLLNPSAQAPMRRIIAGGIVGLMLSITLIAVLYKLLHFEGASQLAMEGGVGTLLSLGIATVYVTVKKRPFDPFYKRLFTRGIAALVVTAVVLFVPTLTFVKIFHSNDPTYIELYSKYQHAVPGDRERAWEEFYNYKNSKK